MAASCSISSLIPETLPLDTEEGDYSFISFGGKLANSLIAVFAASSFLCRVCPGRWVAESFLWITFVTVLATFDISKAIDEDGNEVFDAAALFQNAFGGGTRGCFGESLSEKYMRYAGWGTNC